MTSTEHEAIEPLQDGLLLVDNGQEVECRPHQRLAKQLPADISINSLLRKLNNAYKVQQYLCHSLTSIYGFYIAALGTAKTLMMLGDDRVISTTYILGELTYTN